jgi:hypothetical protein
VQTKISSLAPDGAGFQDESTDWKVVKELLFSLKVSLKCVNCILFS